MTREPRLEPGRVLRMVRQALQGRLSIPLSTLRSRIAERAGDLVIDLAPASPGLFVTGEAVALGARVAFAARVEADGIRAEGGARTVRFRLSDVELSTDDDAPGPLADAIRTGMIDTHNPATLIGNMMPLPDMIVEARGSEVVVDLMKAPAIRRDERVRAALEALTSYLGVTRIRVVDDSIELGIGLLPGGPKEAARSTARAALTPVVRRLWPEGGP